MQESDCDDTFKLCADHWKQVATQPTSLQQQATTSSFTLTRTARVQFYCKPSLNEAVDGLIVSAHTGKPLAKQLLAPFPTISPHICKLFEDNFLSYLLNAYQALDLRPQVDYITKNGVVNIVSTDTGVTMGSAVQWDFGLHQFLQVKHNLKPTTETLSSVFTSSFAYLAKYSQLFGCSGTIGDAAVIDYYKKIPEFKIKHHVFVPPFRQARRVDYPPIIVTTRKQQYQQIILTALAETHLRRSVLVIMDNIKEALVLDREVKKALEAYPAMNVNCFLYTDSNDEDQQVTIEKKCPAATIIISTNLAGRGTSVAIDAFKQFGGLHVILGGGLYSSFRVERQALGRSGRCGEYGSAQMIAFVPSTSAENDDDTPTLFGPDLVDQFNAIRQRSAQTEANMLRSITTLHAPLARFQDQEVFEKLLDACAKEIKGDRNTNQNTTKLLQLQFQHAVLLRQLNAVLSTEQQRSKGELTWEGRLRQSSLKEEMISVVAEWNKNKEENTKNVYITITTQANSLGDALRNKNSTSSAINALLDTAPTLPAQQYLHGVAYLTRSTNAAAGSENATKDLHSAHHHLSLAARAFAQESAQLQTLNAVYIATSSDVNTLPNLDTNPFAQHHQDGYDHFVDNITELLNHVQDVARCGTLRIVDSTAHTTHAESTFSHVMPDKDCHDKQFLETFYNKKEKRFSTGSQQVYLNTTNLPHWESAKIDMEKDLIKVVESGQMQITSKTLGDFATFSVLSNKNNISPGSGLNFEFNSPEMIYPTLLGHMDPLKQHINPQRIALTISSSHQHIKNFLLPYLKSPQVDKQLELSMMHSLVREVDSKVPDREYIDHIKHDAIKRFAENGTYCLYSEKSKITTDKLATLVGGASSNESITLCLDFSNISYFRTFTQMFAHFLPTTTAPQDQHTIFQVSALALMRCDFQQMVSSCDKKPLGELTALGVTATFPAMSSNQLEEILEQLRQNKTDFSIINIPLTDAVFGVYFKPIRTKFLSTYSSHDPAKNSTYQLSARGLPKFFRFGTPDNNFWDLLFLGGMTLSQLVGGALIIKHCPQLRKFGYDSIAEGVGDLIKAIQVYHNPGSFQMKDYWAQKGAAVSGSIIGFAVNDGLSQLLVARKAWNLASAAQKIAHMGSFAGAKNTFTNAALDHLILNTIVNECVEQGLNSTYEAMSPRLARALFVDRINATTSESANKAFSHLDEYLSALNNQQLPIAPSETYQSDNLPQELDQMCYITAYEQVAQTQSYLQTIPFDITDIMTCDANAAVPHEDSVCTTTEMLLLTTLAQDLKQTLLPAATSQLLGLASSQLE